MNKGADKQAIRANLPEHDPESALETLDAAALGAMDDEPIVFTTSASPKKTTGIMIAANITLLLLLGVQFIWSNLEPIFKSPRLRPATAFICGYLPCPTDKLIDLSSLHIDDLSVRSHPSIPGVLQVDFIFRNDASNAQAFPRAELSFSDLNRRLLANRQFSSTEYLPAEMNEMAMMPPKSSIQVQLEILDPGATAVSYALALRAP